MVDPVTVATLAVAAVASLFMAWAIGAGSSGSTPFAPAVGANAISVMRAGFVVGILGLLGAVLQGANVTQAVGGELVVFPDGGGLSAIAAIIALVTAAVLVAIGIFAGYPIATAFTVTGAVVGTGLAMGGEPAIGTYTGIVALWLAVPVVGGTISYTTARVLRSDAVAERRVVPLLAGVVAAILANVRFAVLGDSGESAAIADVAITELGASETATQAIATRAGVTIVAALVGALVLYRDVRRDEAAGQRHFLLVLGGLVAFSAGGSQVGLAVGPLLPLLGPETGVVVPILAVLAFGGLGLLVGSWTGAPRMIKALAQDYSSLGPRRSIAALIPSFAIAQTAVFFGVPVSFNEIIVSGIVGSGAAAGGGEVSGRKMGLTALAWVASLVGSFLIAYGVYTAVSALLL